MAARDEIARRKLEDVRRAVAAGNDYTRPWLDLDVEACARGTLPARYAEDPPARMMMHGVRGMRVLCLAGGGGQQSAVYSLLGARVTVLDLCPEQLESDRAAARHYGYEVTTIEGDVRDLSCLETASFDRVHQPISTLFVPDLGELYAGVARVLAPSGLYFADYAVPLLYMAELTPWDGAAYGLRVREPYGRGAILESNDGVLSFTKGEPISEFHHLLSDIVNGLVDAGLTIRGVWENPRPGSGPPLAELEPGSEAHRERFLPYGISIVAAANARRSFAGHALRLETERLVLRPFEHADFAVALPYYQDPELKATMEGNPDHVVDRDALERAGEYLAQRGYLFAVVEKASGRAIGEICLEWMNLSRACVRPGERVVRTPLGIWDKALWGNGYGREMLECVMRYAFGVLRVDRMCAMDVGEGNVRSRGLFRACGYKEARREPSSKAVDLEITREAFTAVSPPYRPSTRRDS
jgi:RimJ/RimL family protein N-acetyltransferase